jgi:hypothetical protein
MDMPQSADADAWTESMLDCYRDTGTGAGGGRCRIAVGG